MAHPPQKSRLNLFIEYYKHEKNGDYERAIKVTNKILQDNPEDVDAFQCKIVCLIFLNRFEEALNHINKSPKFSDNVLYEKAYCLYRTNELEKALACVERAEPSHACEELRAQILHRLERHAETYEVYMNIIRNVAEDDYEDERNANLLAVVSYLRDREDIAAMRENFREDTYEMCYNKALWHAQREEHDEAERLIKAAERLLRESFEEDGATEEETEAELAHIRVLQAYCYQTQGRTKDAHTIYTSALKQKIEDPALAAVASNNVVVINRDQNVFDSKKKMKTACAEQLVHKLPSSTRAHIALNNAILNFYCNHHDQVNAMVNVIEKQWPALRTDARLLRAMNLARAPGKIEPVGMLLQCAAESTDEAERFSLHMAAVHLLLQQGEKVRACELLANVGAQNQYRPGIVGALITLHMSLGEEDTALRVYERAIEWYKRNESGELNLVTLFKQAADFHMRNGRPQVAAKSLEQLLQSDPDDLRIVAQLVLAYAQYDEKRAIELGKRLAPMDDTEADPEVLESSVWLATKKSTTVQSKTDISPGPVETKKRKHRKRKGKLPKNYDASVAPDAERWLPRYERSGYRKKRDRRQKDVIKGSQGTATGHSDQFDFSQKTAEDDSAPSVEPSPMQKGPGPRQAQKKGGQQKKKNKRR